MLSKAAVLMAVIWLTACTDARPIVEMRTLRLCPPASLAERPVMPQRRDATVRSLSEAYVDALSELRRAQERADELDKWLMRCADE